jgi:exosortase/archaeosortase family protein
MKSSGQTILHLNWTFIGLFSLYYGVCMVLGHLFEGALQTFARFTASAISGFWSAFSVPISCVGTQLAIHGFSMDIVRECTALHYMAIFAAGVISYRAHPLSYRLAGVFFGIVAIFFLNILRIGIVGLVGHYDRALFEFVHLYMWRGIFAILVLFLWILWAHGSFRLSRRLGRYVLISLAAVTGSFWLAMHFLNHYVAFIAGAANHLFPILSGMIRVPVSTVAEDRMIGYVLNDTIAYGDGLIYSMIVFSDVLMYSLNSALFFTLALLTALRSPVIVSLKRIALGTVLLIGQHLLMVIMDWMIENSANPATQSALKWGIGVSSIVAPLLVWLVATKIFSAGKTDV